MVDPVVNYVLSPFEGKIHPGYPQGIKHYIQAAKEIYKEYEKLDISVSNSKDIMDHFISLAKKNVWGRLVFMVETGTGAKNMFRKIEQIHISDMHHHAHG